MSIASWQKLSSSISFHYFILQDVLSQIQAAQQAAAQQAAAAQQPQPAAVEQPQVQEPAAVEQQPAVEQRQEAAPAIESLAAQATSCPRPLLPILNACPPCTPNGCVCADGRELSDEDQAKAHEVTIHKRVTVQNTAWGRSSL